MNGLHTKINLDWQLPFSPGLNRTNTLWFYGSDADSSEAWNTLFLQYNLIRSLLSLAKTNFTC